MSFILDALKKSETDRQRQNGPALFEVRAAPTRDKLPVWAVGLGVLLAINLVIVAWVLLRRPASGEAAAQSATAAPQAGPYGAAGSGQAGRSQGWGAQGQGQPGWGAQGQGIQGPGGQGQGQGQVMQAQGMSQGQQGPGGPQGGAMSQGANGAGYGAPGGAGGPGGYGNGAGPGGYGGATAGGNPGGGFGAPGNGAGQGGYGASGGGGQAGYAAQGNGGGQTGYGAPASGTQPAGPMAQTAGLTAGQQPGQQPGAANAPAQSGEKLNPDDYAPAADPVPQPFGNHVTRGTLSGVPLYNDVSATAALPSLRLDLHVYAATPQERFVMINMHKLHEGDLMTAEGVRVESITPYGAVLSHNGTKFLLPRD